MEIDINKVVITEEAQFDYESLVGLPLQKTLIKNETETYIELMQKSGRLLYGYYFRAKFYDEQSDRILLLFFYKGERFGAMQMWKLVGICYEEDYTENLEDCGQIRVWLNSSLTPEECGDWVWDLRVWQEKKQKEMESYWNDKD